MGHVVGIDIEVSDDAAPEAAAEQSRDLVAVRTRDYDWWGSWPDDYHGADAAYRMGLDPVAYGTREFAPVQRDSPLGLAELAAREDGRRLTHEEANAVRERHHGRGWRTSTSRPYSIGVVRQEGRPGYRLAFDTMDPRLVQKIGGQSADKLRLQYGLATTRAHAARHRYPVTEIVQPNGDVLIRMRLPGKG
jgi:hypothetical protein